MQNQSAKSAALASQERSSMPGPPGLRNRSSLCSDSSMVGHSPTHTEPLWPPLGRLYGASFNSEHAQDYPACIAMVAASRWAGPQSSCPRWAAFMEDFTSSRA